MTSAAVGSLHCPFKALMNSSTNAPSVPMLGSSHKGALVHACLPDVSTCRASSNCNSDSTPLQRHRGSDPRLHGPTQMSFWATLQSFNILENTRSRANQFEEGTTFNQSTSVARIWPNLIWPSLFGRIWPNRHLAKLNWPHVANLIWPNLANFFDAGRVVGGSGGGGRKGAPKGEGAKRGRGPKG